MRIQRKRDLRGHSNDSLGSGLGIGMAWLAFLLGGLAGPASATTIPVTTTSDIVADDGVCSLREAITAVNTGAASGNMTGECAAGDGNNDTITLSANSYIVSLVGAKENNNATGDLDIRANVTIQGATMAGTIVYALNLGAPDRVFDLPVAGVNVTFRDLIIADGHAPDGIPSMFFGTPGEDGGGIRVQSATVTVTRVEFSHNMAGAGVNGGFMNSAGGGSGGAIGINGGTLTISQSIVSQNSAGIMSYGGGGIFGSQSTIFVDECAIDSNAATTSSGFGGGGLLLYYGTTVPGVPDLTVTRSSFTNNSANYGGGISAFGDVITVSNSTFAGNSASIIGGGIYIDRTNAQLYFDTISANTGDGINYNDNSGSNLVNISNSIISGNGGTADCEQYTSGNLASQGYNLAGTGCPANGIGDIATTTPMLSPVANNGGPTETMALQAGSPAINAANACDPNLPATDQRGSGFPRVWGSAPDIGAYEYGVPGDLIFINGFDSVCP